jgi:Flp pilus assembly protein TadG
MSRNPQPTCRRGATLVETAAVLTVFFLFLLGIFEYGRFVMVRNLLDNAAREGARQAVATPELSASTATIQNTVTNYLGGNYGGLTVTNIAVYKVDPNTQANLGSWITAGAGDYIAVQVTATYSPVPLVPWLPSSISLQSTAVMMCEGN